MPEQIEVIFFQRKPYPFHKSLEYIFNDVRDRLPASIHSVTRVFKQYSKGIIPRIKIVWEAYRNQGEINHVTGDIHFAAILLKRSRTMLTVLDCGMLSGSTGIKHQLLKFFWFTLPLKKCSVITVISEATGIEVRRYTSYPPERIVVVPVAISPSYSYFAKAFNKERPEILVVGTTLNKNIPRLLDAVKGLSCTLNIVGRITEEIIDKLKDNNIEYRNAFDISQDELVKQYQLCDLLFFASTYEGFGMPIVEANATGRAVITSNILSMPEVAGDAALLVNPLEVEEIRSGINKLIEDDQYRNDLIGKGLENCKRFNPQHIAEQYFHLYENLHAGKYA